MHIVILSSPDDEAVVGLLRYKGLDDIEEAYMKEGYKGGKVAMTKVTHPDQSTLLEYAREIVSKADLIKKPTHLVSTSFGIAN